MLGKMIIAAFESSTDWRGRTRAPGVGIRS